MSRGRIDSVATVLDNESDSDSDSFKTDSSGDSILDNSFEDSDLDDEDKALQSRICKNFVSIYKKEGNRSFIMRQETKFENYSPSRQHKFSQKKSPKVTTKVVEEVLNE